MMKVLNIWLTGKIWLLINSYSLIRKQLKGHSICQVRYCVNYKTIITTKTLNLIYMIWSFTTSKKKTRADERALLLKVSLACIPLIM